MSRILLVLLIISAIGISCADRRVANKTVLDTYEHGQTLRERVQYHNNDTLVEFVYHENGQIHYKRQVFSNQLNGWSYTFNEDGELIFLENYRNGELAGASYGFYPNGQISRVAQYRNNKNIDTTTYFDEKGRVIKTIEFLSPCAFASRDCDQLVTLFEEGSKVYSYRIEGGVKSGKDQVFNQAIYDKLMAGEAQLTLQEEGKVLFRSNCSMCHGLDNALIGPALACLPQAGNRSDLTQVVEGQAGHASVKLSEVEITALMEYLNQNCP